MEQLDLVLLVHQISHFDNDQSAMSAPELPSRGGHLDGRSGVALGAAGSAASLKMANGA